MLACAVAVLAQLTPPQIPVAGTLQEDGKPVAGASLVLATGYRRILDGDLMFSGGYPPSAVIGRATTAGDGTFTVHVPLPENPTFGDTEPVLTAWQGDRFLAAAVLDLYALMPGVPLALEAHAAPPARFCVVDAAATPLAGVAVQIAGVRVAEGGLLLPADLGSALRATTDRDGFATFPQLALEQVAAVRIVSSAHGAQNIVARRDGSGLDVITLRATGCVRGKVTAAAGALPGGVRVTVNSQAPMGPDRRVDPELRRTAGIAEVISAADGSFEVPALAVGVLWATARAPDGSGCVARMKSSGKPTELTPDTAAEIAIETMPGVALRGVVRDRDKDAPLAGCRVRVFAGSSPEWFATDAEGTFRCLVPVGNVTVGLVAVSQEFLPAAEASPFGRSVAVAADQTEVECTPIELSRGATIRGRVVDAHDKPVAGARVSTTWTEPVTTGPMRSTRMHRRLAFTDVTGRFALLGIPASTKPEVKVAHAGAEAEPVLGDTTAPLRLVLGAAGAGPRLSARVLDARGNGIAGARAFLARRWQSQPGYAESFDDYRRAGAASVVTSEGGNLSVPIEKANGYAVRFEAPGHWPRWVGWSRVDDRQHRLDDVALRPTSAVRGRLRTLAGAPCAGAQVFAPSDAAGAGRATADDGGEFTLPDVRHGSVFLVVRHAGKVSAHRVDVGPGAPADLVVDAPRVARAAAWPDAAQRRALATRLAAPYVETALAQGSDSDRLRGLQTLAWCDPEGTLARAATATFAEAWYRDYVVSEVVQATLARDFDEGLMLAASLSAAETRAFRLLSAAADLPLGPDTDKRRRLVAEGLMQARACASPLMKVAMLAMAADAFVDLGDEEAAKHVIEETAPMVAQLPDQEWAGFARCRHAERLALFDLDAALRIVGAQKDAFSFDRHHGNIAHELAGRDPAAAERVFAMVKTGPSRFVARVCYRMAPVDLERARKIAMRDGIAPRERAWSMGVMAEALRSHDVDAARALLREAFALVKKEKLADVAAALLDIAANVEPDAMAEFVARALACRQPLAKAEFYVYQRNLGVHAALGLALLPHDAEAGASVLEPLWDEAAVFAALPGHEDSLLAALVYADPERAAALVEGLAEADSVAWHAGRNRARLTVAKLLTISAAARRDYFLERCVNLWPIDKEDL